MKIKTSIKTQEKIILPSGTFIIGPSSVGTTSVSTKSPEEIAKEFKKAAKEDLFPSYPSLGNE